MFFSHAHMSRLHDFFFFLSFHLPFPSTHIITEFVRGQNLLKGGPALITGFNHFSFDYNSYIYKM